MKKIPKKLHYVWFWKWKKSESFQKYLKSWKKYCPDYEIIEWNEDNFNISQNIYCKKFYDKKLYAFASDYARIKILYEQGWIYLDTDIEILKNLDDLLKSESFVWFQDVFSVWLSIMWSKAKNPILKDILDIYENKRSRIIITNLITKLLKKKYNLKKYDNKIQDLEYIKIFPKDYFYPYAYFEKKRDMEITRNTYTIHHYDVTWLPKIVTNLFFPLIRYFVDTFYKK